MSVAELLVDLTRLGIRLESHGDRLRYSPKAAVTSDLTERMKTYKGELLAMFGPKAGATDIHKSDAASVWQAALARLDGDPLFPSDLMEALRSADAHWAANDLRAKTVAEATPEALDKESWPADCIDPDELTPCRTCGSLELWQTLAGNWRCQNCEPPTSAQRVSEAVERIRRRKRRTRRDDKYWR
jgi:hypothetical protein